MAFHPTTPVGAVPNFDADYTYGETWADYTGDDYLETCPAGWRRPTVGSVTTSHFTQYAYGSEVMQSLFYNTFDNYAETPNRDNYRYWGYYADGYFDRRPIESANNMDTDCANTAVSTRSKNVAYIGVLFTNPANNASLFAPAAGTRFTMENGARYVSGVAAYYLTSSNYDWGAAWSWEIDTRPVPSVSRQNFRQHATPLSLRCVLE
jgi:hypothetical protein